MNKIIIVLASMMLIIGCDDDKPYIGAPDFIKPHLHHLYRTVPECFRQNNLATGEYDCSVGVTTVPATGEYRGHPTYERDGKRVGGVTIGNCRASSQIIMPVFGTRYSQDALQHEVCHAYDLCRPCRTGHPAEYEKCCPSWPYLKSLDTGEETPIQCITGEAYGQTVNVTIYGDDIST